MDEDILNAFVFKKIIFTADWVPAFFRKGGGGDKLPYNEHARFVSLHSLGFIHGCALAYGAEVINHQGLLYMYVI